MSEKTNIRDQIINEILPMDSYDHGTRIKCTMAMDKYEEALVKELAKANDTISEQKRTHNIQHETMNNLEEHIVYLKEIIKQCRNILRIKYAQSPLMEKINKVLEKNQD